MTMIKNPQVINLQTFNFHDTHNVRVEIINGEPHFCLTDVCRVLGIPNASNVKTRLNPKGVLLKYTLTKGGRQPLNYVTESNLYKIIFRSDKPQAREFEDWVTSEVLPAIRQKGAYLTPAINAEVQTLPPAPRRHNRLTPVRVARLLSLVCEVENAELRNALKSEVLGGGLW